MATVDLTRETFEGVINDNDIILVDFWAPWCGPCRQFAPVFEKLSEQHPDIVFSKVNTEDERELAAHFQIRSIPTLMVFRQQIIVFAQPGALPPAALATVLVAADIGDYVGKALNADATELSPRDMSVRIESAGRSGFELQWISVIKKADGRVKRSDVTIRFLPSYREGLYASAMTKNMFGQPVPFDPLKGGPYAWAKLDGDVLTVHALHITDTGGYEMQAYERRLVEGGLELRYNRIRDGEILRTVTGFLKRK